MKKTLLAGAIAVFAITPALAQQGRAPYAAPERAGAYTPYASGPYAYVGAGSPVFIGGQLAISVDGQIIGADPDPSIRSDLLRNQDVQLGRGGN
jgi:hypothetical protein